MGLSNDRIMELFDEYKRLGKHPLTKPRRRVIAHLLQPYHFRLEMLAVSRGLHVAKLRDTIHPSYRAGGYRG